MVTKYGVLCLRVQILEEKKVKEENNKKKL